MANYKSKRSTRSSQRGRGKNHSVNREKSFDARKRHRIMMLNRARFLKKREELLTIAREYWAGIRPDLCGD